MFYVNHIFEKIYKGRKLFIFALILIIFGVIIAEVFSNELFKRSPFFSSITKSSSNVIVLENAHQGTTDWKISPQKLATIQIQAYADATSVLPGQKLIFYVSTINANTPYSIDIYRLGWYGGSGGRLVSLQRNLMSQSQGYYD